MNYAAFIDLAALVGFAILLIISGLILLLATREYYLQLCKRPRLDFEGYKVKIR